MPPRVTIITTAYCGSLAGAKLANHAVVELSLKTQGNFVPVNESDFIFTVIGEEAGFIGAAITILLLSIILWRGMRIAMGAGELYGRLVAAGVVAWLAFQTFENIGMNLGIMPITGVPLPFVSYGGTSMFASWIALGLLQNVRLHREQTP